MDETWSLDFKALRYFACIAEQKSFSGAASRLRIAQPALSRQIRRLEETLGVTLLTRHARGVGLVDFQAYCIKGFHIFVIFTYVYDFYHDS